jgi:hypothetical protein
MAKSSKAYFGLGLPFVANLLLAIFFGGVLGIVERIIRGKYLLAILNFVLAPIFWVIDVVSFIVNKDLKWLA